VRDVPATAAAAAAAADADDSVDSLPEQPGMKYLPPATPQAAGTDARIGGKATVVHKLRAKVADSASGASVGSPTMSQASASGDSVGGDGGRGSAGAGDSQSLGGLSKGSISHTSSPAKPLFLTPPAEDEEDERDNKNKLTPGGTSGTPHGGKSPHGRSTMMQAPVKKGPRSDAKTLQEIELLLADAYYRRSQCKQLLVNTPSASASAGPDDTNVSDAAKLHAQNVILPEALSDSRKAAKLCPEDDDYQLDVATCYLKLRRFEEALNSFAIVLQRSPHNDKALYQYAFCQRALGRNRDAIEGLTSIISTATKKQNAIERGEEPDPTYKISVPLERVYETRGALFHEMHAHQLALQDFGRAIALNPDTPENFFLRGNCHAKLGNHELALKDFNAADERGMKDSTSLHVSRGMVRRTCGDSEGARADFDNALARLHETNGIPNIPTISRPLLPGEISTTTIMSISEAKDVAESGASRADAALLELRLISLRALTFLDVGMYNAGHGVLVNAITYVNQIEEAMLEGYTLPESILNMELRVWEEEQKVAEEKKLAAGKVAAEKKALEEAKTMAGREKAAAKKLAEEKAEKANAMKSASDKSSSGNGAATSRTGEADGVPSAEDVEKIAKEAQDAVEGVSCVLCPVSCVLCPVSCVLCAYVNQIEEAMLEGYTLPESILNMELRVWEEEQKVAEEKKLAAGKVAAEKKALEEAKTMAGREKAAAKKLAEEKAEKANAMKSASDKGSSGNGAATSRTGEADGVLSAEDVEKIAKEAQDAVEGVSCVLCSVFCALRTVSCV